MYQNQRTTHLEAMTPLCDACLNPLRGHTVHRPDFHGHLDCWVIATLRGHTIGGTLAERLDRA